MSKKNRKFTCTYGISGIYWSSMFEITEICIQELCRFLCWLLLLLVFDRQMEVKNMVEKKVKFMSAGQIMTFCNTCQKLKSDVDVTDMANRNYIIDGKSLMGLMSIKLGLPMRVVVNGQDEEEANECFSNYEFE